jgi:glycine reductase
LKTLELGYIHIKDIVIGSESKIENGVLYVNEAEMKALILEDEALKDVRFDVAKPGESTRITPVKDVIEPRFKVSGNGGVFPGMVNKVDVVGEGRTHVLKDMAVVTCGKIVGYQEGIIDMSGTGAEYTPFSKTINLVMIAEPADFLLAEDADATLPIENIHKPTYERAVRMAGLKLAHYLGEISKDMTPDEVETFSTPNLKEGIELYPDLPRVVYVAMLQTQGLLHDTYVYGVDAKRTLTTMLWPTEIMDGAIVSGNCVSACDKNPTYIHLNNPVVHELFKQHGKTINFVGVIITNENVYLADKQRSSDWTAKLCELLGVDGAIVTQEGFGNPDTDLIMNAKKIALKNVKTTIVTDEYAGQDGTSQSLADSDPLADAVVTGGNANQVIILPKMDKVIGMLDYVDVVAGGHQGSLREDGTIEAEIQIITSATNEMGFNKLSAR